jgi:hypothetical protein
MSLMGFEEGDQIMERALKALLIILVPALSFTQTVYHVPADSRGNTIILAVANESATTPMRMLVVRPVKSGNCISISPGSIALKTLAVNSTVDVSFVFDVGREVKLNRRDTLDFEILEGSAIVGTKAIIVSYEGPREFKLAQNFPNPFNPTTRIHYDLPAECHVSIVVYDILGRLVGRPVDEVKPAGYHAAEFDARGVASGAYVYRMVAHPMAGGKAFTDVRKFMVMR